MNPRAALFLFALFLCAAIIIVGWAMNRAVAPVIAILRDPVHAITPQPTIRSIRKGKALVVRHRMSLPNIASRAVSSGGKPNEVSGEAA